MKEITILSGKGGTGKTSITVALASLALNAVFCDNDVDAADMHLIFNPKNKEEHTFSGGWKAQIDVDKCTDCGLCVSYCRFNAIHTNENNQLIVNPYQCEGCRLCERICPEKAIISQRSENNLWFVASSRFGDLVHARMGPGEENSGKLVSEVRKRAKQIAFEKNASYIINDGPPGIGCATISSLSGTDLVLMVLEPSKSGLHDAERLIDLIKKFNIQVLAVINKSTINQVMVKEIEISLLKLEVPLIGKIPFDKNVVTAMVEGKTIIEFDPHSAVSSTIRNTWESIKETLQN